MEIDDTELARLRTAESILRNCIQVPLATRPWEKAGDFYRGKNIFIPVDTLNQIDSALDEDVVVPATE